MDWRREVAVVKINFSVAFDCVGQTGLLFKLLHVGVDGAVFNVFVYFSSGREQKVEVHVVLGENVRVVLGELQES